MALFKTRSGRGGGRGLSRDENKNKITLPRSGCFEDIRYIWFNSIKSKNNKTMKKGLFIVLFALLAGVSAHAQAFQGKGSSQISVGITSGFNSYDILGVQGNYDYGVADFISVGGQVNLLFDDDFKMYVGPRANFHLLNAITPSKPGPFDVYLGATMGVQFGDKTKFTGGGYLGASYDITSQIAVKLEAGSNIMAGVLFRL